MRLALLLEPAKRRDAESVATLTRLLAGAIEKHGAVRAHFVQDFYASALSEARGLLAEAKAAVSRDHSMARAAEHQGRFWSARLAYRGAPGSATGVEVAEVHVGLAAARHEQGDVEGAKDHVITALNTNPKLDKRAFFGSGGLRDLFERVRASASARPTGAVKVSTKPSGAEVWVGDELRGFSPVTLELPTGTQLVRVRKNGYYTHGWFADVSEKSRSLQKDLVPLAGRKRYETWKKRLLRRYAGKERADAAAKDGAAADGIRRLMQAPNLVVAKVKKTKTAYELRGFVATRGRAPTRLEVDLALDATMLSSVDALASTFVE